MQSALKYRLSRGVLTTISPPIPKAYQWAEQYIPTSTRPLLDMSQGVPGVPPPLVVQEALGKAASSPTSFGYCRWNGEPALRKVLAEEMKVVYGKAADLDVDDIALTAGCNMAFIAVIMSLADPTEEVVLPTPWYVYCISFSDNTSPYEIIRYFNHQMSLNLLGIKVVALPTGYENGFMPSVEECRALITPKTKAIVLVTPNNPTGATYSPSLIASFAALAREKNIALVLDETYRDFIVTGLPPHNLFSSDSQAWRTNIIQLFSFSKAYCLPGHRLGAITASPILLDSVKTVLDSIQICPPRPIQLALAPLLPSLRPFLHETARAVNARHCLFKALLPKNWKIGAQGGYFAFVRHPYIRVGAQVVSQRLAIQLGVVTLPAQFFTEGERQQEEHDVCTNLNGWAESKEKVDEGERWIRFSVANIEDEKVRRVCDRLKESEDIFHWELELE